MKRLICFAVFCLTVAVAPLAHADFAVIPTTTEGAGNEGTALGGFSNTAQVVYNQSVIAAAGINVGDVINGLSFRVNVNQPAPVWSVEDYQIRLGTSQNSAGSLDANFVTNRGADYTVVRSGPLAFDGTEFQATALTGDDPNAFGPTLGFDNFFTYTGGDLLVEYTHSFIDANAEGVVGTAADAVGGNLNVQTQFSSGFDTTTEAFGGFGGGIAPVIRLSVAAVPEPSSIALLFGIGMAGVARRRRA